MPRWEPDASGRLLHAALELFTERGYEATTAALARRDDVKAAIAQAVEEANSHLARVEQIKRFAILEEEWMPGGEELTPTMKLKRRPIAEKYAAEIEALYG